MEKSLNNVSLISNDNVDNVATGAGCFQSSEAGISSNKSRPLNGLKSTIHGCCLDDGAGESIQLNNDVSDTAVPLKLSLSQANAFCDRSKQVCISLDELSAEDLASCTVPFKIQLRCLRPENIEQVKRLCMERYQLLKQNADAVPMEMKVTNRRDDGSLPLKLNEKIIGQSISTLSSIDGGQASKIRKVSDKLEPPKKRPKLDAIVHVSPPPTVDYRRIEANSVWRQLPAFIFDDSADNGAWRPQLQIDLLDKSYLTNQLTDTFYDPNGFLHVTNELVPSCRVVRVYRNERHQRITVADLCDCCSSTCAGCFMPCLVCSSTRCGYRCRCNRRSKPIGVRLDGIGGRGRVFFPVKVDRCLRGLSNFLSL